MQDEGLGLDAFYERTVIIDGKAVTREAQVREGDDQAYCLRSSREKLIWGQRKSIKPCTMCTGVLITEPEKFEDLIEDISKGVRRDECSACWKDEDAGFPSYREMGNEFWLKVGNGNSHTEIVYNRNCNAACIYCSAKNSTTWQKEIEESTHNVPASFSQYVYAIRDLEDAVGLQGSEKITKAYVKEHVKALALDHNKMACIGVYGGEPTLEIIEEDHLGFIVKTFYENNKMWNRTLRYDLNTNLNFSKKRCYEIVDYLYKYKNEYPFLDIIIQPSFESIGKNFNFIKYGCDWNTFETNFDIFLKETDFKIEVKSMINNVSLKHLPKFLEYTNDKARDARPFDIEIDYIYEPRVFSIQMLDGSFKKYLGDVWHYLENNKPYWRNIDDMVVQLQRSGKIIDSLPEPEVIAQSKKALEIYEYFKKERGMDLLEYNPELYYYFKMMNMSSN